MARPSGVFVILPQKEVEKIAAQAATLLAQGRNVMEYEDSATRVKKSYPSDPMTVLRECRYALQILDPKQYGAIDRVREFNGLWQVRGM